MSDDSPASSSAAHSGVSHPTTHFTFDGRGVTARAGQSIAAAVLAAGETTLRWTSSTDSPRGLFCGMGICFDCLVTVDGRRNVQACRTPVAEGLVVTRQRGPGDPPLLPAAGADMP